MIIIIATISLLMIILVTHYNEALPVDLRAELDACLADGAWGNKLHARSHTHEIPLENATEYASDNSRQNPLERSQSSGKCR